MTPTRRVSVSTTDPVGAALVLSSAMTPRVLDELVRLLLATPDLDDTTEEDE